MDIKMNITSAKWVDVVGLKKFIIANIDGEEIRVPSNESNRHYAEIKRQVDAGELTIEDAD